MLHRELRRTLKNSFTNSYVAYNKNNITHLNCVGSLNHGHIPEDIGKFSESLVYLNLSNNKIKELPDFLLNLNKLKELDISNNQIESDSLKNIPKSVKRLYLRSNNFTNIDDVLDDNNFYDMTLLDVSNNYLREIPQNILNFKNLQFVNFSSNNFYKVCPNIKRFLYEIDSESHVKLHKLCEPEIGRERYYTSPSENYVSNVRNIVREYNGNLNVSKHIMESNNITSNAKNVLKEYIDDKTIDGHTYCIFEDVLCAVVSRIEKNNDYVPIYNIMNKLFDKKVHTREVYERINLLISCLRGFYSDIV